MFTSTRYLPYFGLLLCLSLLLLFVACEIVDLADESGDEQAAVSAEEAQTDATNNNNEKDSPEDDGQTDATNNNSNEHEDQDEQEAASDEQDGDPEAYVPRFEEHSCPFEVPEGEDGRIECGYLYVLEDRSEPEGREIELAVAIIRSHRDNPAPDPIIYLEGGPGGSALSDPDSWLESPLRDQRDIILLDQRGTGFSVPSLNCIEMEEEEEDVLQAVQACRDRLANDGVKLAAYHSANNAADVNELRITLGYDEWNLLGISYGTRLALTIMRDFPAGIRSVVLDSVYPPNIDAYTEQPVNNADAIQAMLDGCAANAACHDAYPDLEAKFYELIAQLNDQPVEFEEQEIYGDQIVDQLVQSLYDIYTIPELPFILDEAYHENYEPLIELIAPAEEEEGASRRSPPLTPPNTRGGTVYLDSPASIGGGTVYFNFPPSIGGGTVYLDSPPSIAGGTVHFNSPPSIAGGWGGARQDGEGDISDSEGMFYSVECHEEIPFGDLQEAEKLVAKYPAQVADGLLAGLEQEYESCQIWNNGQADPIESEPVYSDIPTLLLAGEYDPVTPPSWAKLAAETLSNHHYFEIPGGGHALIDAGECPLGLIVAFIDNPNANLDGSCVQSLEATFVVP